MKKLKVSGTVKYLYACIFITLIWYALHLAVGSVVIPSPVTTLTNFIAIFPQTLLIHLLVSLSRVVAAITVSLLLGSLIGLWIGTNKKADSMLTPILYILYPIPKIAFLPILMILFGLGNASKIILIIIIIIFQFVIAARDSVLEIPKELFYSVLSLGLGRLDIYRHLILPAALPGIFTALRISTGISISIIFFAENFASRYGIGYFIMNSWVMVNYVDMFSGILALSILGLLLFGSIDLLEERLCGWMKAGKSFLN
ncbi:MAG TPA: ABC transporter permease subunit [Clostridia bacterium]|nr:ABC transporter permease subunit [Clostridia bacterium]